MTCVRSPLLTMSRLIFSPNTKMFQFLGLLIRHLPLGFLGDSVITVIDTDFSYLITSFIASGLSFRN